MKLKPIFKRKNSEYNQDVIEIVYERSRVTGAQMIKFWCNNCERYLYLDSKPREILVKRLEHDDNNNIYIKAKTVCRLCGTKAKFNTLKEIDYRMPIPGRRVPKK